MPEQVYAWDGIREGLVRIAALNPSFLPNTVLVGDAACSYYRLALAKAGYKDFPVPEYTPDEERVWLSKDLDFMGESPEEISDLIGQPCPSMGTLVTYAETTLNFIAEGLKLTREAANRTARKAQAGTLEFYIVSPGLLFAEKHACTLLKKRPQDPLHREVMARFIKMDLCRSLEQPMDLDTKEWLNEAKTADIQFFNRDVALSRRLHSSVQGLPTGHSAIEHWIRHHVAAAGSGSQLAKPEGCSGEQ